MKSDLTDEELTDELITLMFAVSIYFVGTQVKTYVDIVLK